MQPSVRLLSFKADIGMSPKKCHEALHPLGRSLISLLFQHDLIVQIHARLPSAYLVSKGLIHGHKIRQEKRWYSVLYDLRTLETVDE